MVENPVNEKIFKMTCPNFNLSLGQVKSKSDTLGPLLSDIKLIEHANVNFFFYKNMVSISSDQNWAKASL